MSRFRDEDYTYFRNIVTICFLFWMMSGLSSITMAKENPGKNRILMLYADSTYQPLLPNIDNILRNLKNYKNDSLVGPLFKEVINLNTWMLNRPDQDMVAKLIRTLEMQEPGARREMFERSRVDEIESDVLADKIQNATDYIRITTRQIHPTSLIEIQFIITNSIYDELLSDQKRKYKVLITDSTRTVGLVIDLAKKDYMRKLEHCLKKIFPQSNRLPKPVLVSRQQPNDDCHYFGKDEVGVFDASKSYDLDDQPEPLSFEWDQVQPWKQEMVDPTIKLAAASLEISPHLDRQSLQFPKLGFYKIDLSVSDGISTAHDTILIEVVNTPTFESDQIDTSVFVQGYIWDGLVSNINFEVPFKSQYQDPENKRTFILHEHFKDFSGAFPIPFVKQRKSNQLLTQSRSDISIGLTTLDEIDSLQEGKKYVVNINHDNESNLNAVTNEITLKTYYQLPVIVSDTMLINIRYKKLPAINFGIRYGFTHKLYNTSIPLNIFQPTLALWLSDEFIFDCNLGNIFLYSTDKNVEHIERYSLKYYNEEQWGGISLGLLYMRKYEKLEPGHNPEGFYGISAEYYPKWGNLSFGGDMFIDQDTNYYTGINMHYELPQQYNGLWLLVNMFSVPFL